jgi:phosphotransferase system  glucose/maltose/N-acetylglucosamine-specific IIC component
MKKVSKNKKFVRKIASSLEICISVIILSGVILGSLDMIRTLYEAYFINGGNMGYEAFNEFLGHTILLVIGIELVTMFTLHSSKALLEVLVFAIAHKLILMPKTQSMGELLLGVIGIGCLFAIKKYLIAKEDANSDSEEDIEKDSKYIV